MKRLLLVDNGSLEPAAVFALREIAARLSTRIGQTVFPASLAHSEKIPPAALGGIPAPCLDTFLRAALARGEREFAILPFFIGPSRAVTHALPKLIKTLKSEFPNLRATIAPPLHSARDNTLARILASRVRGALRELAVRRIGDEASPAPVRVAVVDHGSPTREVTAVRDEVTAQVAALLRSENAIEGAAPPRLETASLSLVQIAPCSMERRPGAAYDFNAPLLETLLARAEWQRSTLIVAPLFLLPGRHAGPGGDIAQICARHRPSPSGLASLQTAPIGPHTSLINHLTQHLPQLAF